MRLRRVAVMGLAVLLAVSSGCNPFRRERQPKVPPPVSPAPLPPKPRAEPAPAGKSVWWEFPPPPEVAPAPPSSIPPPPIQAQFPKGPPPKVRRPIAAASPETEAEPPKAPPVPRLTQLLSPEEERQYNREIDEALERAHRHVALVSQRPLNPEQQVLLERVNAFLQQTVEIRQLDLVTARSLAQRADLLARDLERSTR